MQSGYKRTVKEFYIVARSTVDEVSIDKRDKKAITQEKKMAYAKGKGGRKGSLTENRGKKATGPLARCFMGISVA